MSRRKSPQTFDVDGLKQVEARLREDSRVLVGKCRKELDCEMNWSAAIALRDIAQLLIKTWSVLDNMPTCMTLAEHRGQTHVPSLDECGLDKLDDE